MTAFIKENFRWDGMYLTYEGEQGALTEYYVEPCHPTRLGTAKSAFIARFKYRKPWKTFVNFLVKNFTVEEYLTRMNDGESPQGIMESKGYIEAWAKKMCREAGFAPTVEGYKAMIRAEVEKNMAARGAA